MNLQILTDEQVRRKMEQAWEMSGLARQDGDKKDEERWIKEARMCQDELRSRIEI